MPHRRRPLVVGLTGGIGSGKSTVAAMFADLGVPVISADQVARDVVSPGAAALQQIVKHFGPELLDDQGALRRDQLRARVFQDAAERHWLESLLHPLIRQQIRARIAAVAAPYVIVESPLLLEAGQRDTVDRVLVVDAAEDQQLQRTISRDHNEAAQVQAIMDSQLNRRDRLGQADDVIENQGSLEDLAPQVRQLHLRYLAMSRGN